MGEAHKKVRTGAGTGVSADRAKFEKEQPREIGVGGFALDNLRMRLRKTSR